MPAMKYRWPKMNSKIIGSVASADIAIRKGHWTLPEPCAKVARPNCSGRRFSEALLAELRTGRVERGDGRVRLGAATGRHEVYSSTYDLMA
jgi:hypothetical protein